MTRDFLRGLSLTEFCRRNEDTLLDMFEQEITQYIDFCSEIMDIEEELDEVEFTENSYRVIDEEKMSIDEFFFLIMLLNSDD